MNKYKYRTGKFERTDSIEIEKIKIDRETNKSIWIDGIMWRKENMNDIFHNTFQEAQSYLLSKYRIKIRNLGIEIDRANKRHIILNAKKETDCK